MCAGPQVVIGVRLAQAKIDELTARLRELNETISDLPAVSGNTENIPVSPRTSTATSS